MTQEKKSIHPLVSHNKTAPPPSSSIRSSHKTKPPTRPLPNLKRFLFGQVLVTATGATDRRRDRQGQQLHPSCSRGLSSVDVSGGGGRSDSLRSGSSGFTLGGPFSGVGLGAEGKGRRGRHPKVGVVGGVRGVVCFLSLRRPRSDQ